MFEAIRYSALPAGFAFYERLKDKDHSIFMAGTTYTLTKEANDLRAKSHWGVNFPLLANLKIIYVGKSSFSFEIVLNNYTAHIATAVLTFVYVDFKSRRPVPFPGWFRDVRAEKASVLQPLPPQRLPTPEIPEAVFRYETRAIFSDIDFNKHVNQSVYVRWCTDAGAEAASRRFYKDFRQDIGVYDIEKMEVKYIGEGMLDDEFVVNTWQDKEIPFTIHFVVTKQGKVSFVGRFSYCNDSVKQSKL